MNSPTVSAAKPAPFSFPEAARAFELDPVSSHFESLMKFVGTNPLGDDGVSTKLVYWTHGAVDNALSCAAALPDRVGSDQAWLAKEIPLYIAVGVEALVKHEDREFARVRGYEEVKRSALSIAAALADGNYDKEAAEVLRQFSRARNHFEPEMQKTENILATAHLPSVAPEKNSGLEVLPVPWTDAQVEALNRFQHSGHFHPYTGGEDGAPLIATRDGWVSKVGGPVVQTWVLAASADPAFLQAAVVMKEALFPFVEGSRA